MLDVEKLVQGVQEYIARAIAPMSARIAAQDAEIKALRETLVEVAKIEPAEPADIRPAIDAAVKQAFEALPKPQDGKSVDPEDMRPILGELVAEAVKAAVSEIPIPENGEPGASVSVEDVRPLIADEVKRAMAEAPAPQDGKSVSVDDVLPQLMAELQKAVEAFPRPKDGQNGKSLTLDDLEPMKSAWALDFERYANGVLQRAIDKFPLPKDGQDGFSLDDLSMEYDGERTVSLKFERGDLSKSLEIVLPTIIDRGVYSPEAQYVKSDAATFGGCLWIAQKNDPGKPGEPGNDGWRLAVKKGRDGKDGRDLSSREIKPVKV